MAKKFARSSVCARKALAAKARQIPKNRQRQRVKKIINMGCRLLQVVTATLLLPGQAISQMQKAHPAQIARVDADGPLYLYFGRNHFFCRLVVSGAYPLPRLFIGEFF
jgi:hypothetical protein